MSADYRLNLQPLSLENTEGRTREVLEKAKAGVGFVPNMYAYMGHSPALLETYLDGYARFRSESGFTPAEQEVVFLAISRENGCDYCMAAHSMLGLKQSGVPAEVVEALRNDRPIPDAKLKALADFTRTMVQKRGFIDKADARTFLEAGFEEKHILGVILAMSVKTLSNYTNHIAHTPVDDIFAEHAWKAPEASAA